MAPKRKISVDEALAALKDAGRKVTVVKEGEEVVVEQPVAYTEKVRDYSKPYGKPDYVAPLPKSRVPKTVKVTLYARHSVGSGGNKVMTDDGKQIEHVGVEYYGPGVNIDVPGYLVEHLLHADAAARQADERFLSREPVFKLVMPRLDGSGGRQNVAVTVHDDVLDIDQMLTNLPVSATYVIKG